MHFVSYLIILNIIILFNFYLYFRFGISVVTITGVKVIKTIKKTDYAKSLTPFINLIIIILCECLISYFNSYKSYLLYYIVLNGLFFGITVSKLIMSTMSGKPQTIPCIEGIVYLLSILLGLKFSEFEFAISVFQGIFIASYYVLYYGKLIKQLMRELKIAQF